MKERQFVAKLNWRSEYSIHYVTANGKEIIAEGSKAHAIVDRFKFFTHDVSNIKFLQVDCASSGKVRGKVSIINSVAEMQKMKEGNVLVSTATSPDLMPAIRKAVAIVTDTGDITCHAAIVFRELGIPCVIGTKIATRALNDGDTVNVDATHGKITLIKCAKIKNLKRD